MGEVYRARDRKLNRDVAIKVIPPAFASDPDRMARFQREAEVLASLNHPNIAQIYAIEERSLVMELVPGETLKGPLPLATALNYAKQIAEALDAAHEKGIVHRDLKSGNIMITPEGVVKVLDFGLAAVGQDQGSAKTDPINSPTLTMRATEAGLIMGTAAYMSPEQASGKPVDKRADIWSFGVVLWEMLTGQQLFAGETLSHTLADVLRAPIDFDKLPKETPGMIRDLLRRCLNRDIKMRLQSIGEARIVLSGPMEETATAAITAPSRSRLGWVAWALAGVMTIALGIALWALWRANQPVNRPLVRLDVDLGAGVSLLPLTDPGSSAGSSVAISPDGTRLAYVSGTSHKLFTRRLDQSKSTELPGAVGVAPFFSADSQWIGFETLSGKVNKISVEGGVVVPLAYPGGLFTPGNWSEDGNIYVGVYGKGLARIPDDGGAPETIAPPAKGETLLGYPQLLPGGKAVLFSAYTGPGPDASSIEVLTTGGSPSEDRFPRRHISSLSGHIQRRRLPGLCQQDGPVRDPV